MLLYQHPPSCKFTPRVCVASYNWYGNLLRTCHSIAYLEIADGQQAGVSGFLGRSHTYDDGMATRAVTESQRCD